VIALFLVLLQAPADTAYATPALRALISRAADLNAVVPALSYRAHFESEIAMNKAMPDRVEGISSVEQYAGTLTWSGDSANQHNQGYRAVTTGLPLPAGYVLSSAWIVPNLYGDRFTLLSSAKKTGPDSTSAQDSLDARADNVVHPLASDRDRYYRFSGGDTVEVQDARGRRYRVVVVHVTPHASFTEAARLFTGEVYLEVGTGALLRLRGQIYSVRAPGKPLTGLKKIANALVASASIIDFQNERIDGVLIPTYQSGDLAVLIPLTTAAATMVRMVTRLDQVTIQGGGTVALGPGALPPETQRTEAPRDSLGRFRDWEDAPTDWPSRYLINDRLDVGPPKARPTGKPVFFFRAPNTYEFFRFNRVEGIYTGIAGTLFFRDAAPGLALRGGVGYGWWDQQLKGGLVATLDRGRSFYELTARRELAIVTKFRDPLDYSMGTRPIFAQDLYDYTNRLVGQVSAGYRLEKHRSGVIRADVGVAQDQLTPQELFSGPVGQTYYPLAAVDPGTYFRSRLSLIWREDISSRFARPGIGAQVYLENGQGDLQYTIVNARVVGRQNVNGLILSFVGYGGLSRAPTLLPTQQLFLIGGSFSLPGYDFDQFGGDQALLLTGSAGFILPFLRQPIPVSKKLALPALNPNITMLAYVGWTGASNATAQASLDRLGTRVNSDNQTVPFSVPTNGAKGSVQIKLGLFGNFLGFGLARTLEADGNWAFIFTISQYL
jgi:hypothetical protein